MLRQVSEDRGQTAALRGALARAYEVLREPDLDKQLALIAHHLSELLDTSMVRIMRHQETGWITPGSDDKLPASALAMEAALLPRVLNAERSLLSSHPLLDPDLADLSARCSTDQCIVHVLLVRAHRQTYGVFAAHWL